MWGGDDQRSIVDPRQTQSDSAKAMATINTEEQEKPSGRKKPKSARTGIMQFVKGKWESEDAVEDDKVYNCRATVTT